jgi:hypothetical protein
MEPRPFPVNLSEFVSILAACHVRIFHLPLYGQTIQYGNANTPNSLNWLGYHIVRAPIVSVATNVKITVPILLLKICRPFVSLMLQPQD